LQSIKVSIYSYSESEFFKNLSIERNNPIFVKFCSDSCGMPKASLPCTCLTNFFRVTIPLNLYVPQWLKGAALNSMHCIKCAQIHNYVANTINDIAIPKHFNLQFVEDKSKTKFPNSNNCLTIFNIWKDPITKSETLNFRPTKSVNEVMTFLSQSYFN
jgi:hypothetical protein